MSDFRLFIVLLLLVNTTAFSQQKKTERYTRDVTKLTLLEPGIAHEFSLGRSTTLMLRTGVMGSFAINNNENFTGILFRAFVAGSYRAYYNFEKREFMEKNTSRNSANYIALLIFGGSAPFNKGDNYRQNYNDPLLNAGIVWGLQRNYNSRISLDLNIGLGYSKVGYDSGLAGVGELNIGLWLGKRPKNKD